MDHPERFLTHLARVADDAAALERRTAALVERRRAQRRRLSAPVRYDLATLAGRFSGLSSSLTTLTSGEDAIEELLEQARRNGVEV